MDLQKEINKLDTVNAEHALARLGGVGTVDYFVLYTFISHVKRLQVQQRVPALFRKATPEEQEVINRWVEGDKDK